MKSAVERQFEVIGGALSQLAKADNVFYRFSELTIVMTVAPCQHDKNGRQDRQFYRLAVNTGRARYPAFNT